MTPGCAWSTCGVWLTLIWWPGFLMHAIMEERRLEQELGEEYAEYRRKGKGRFLPGLPV